MDFHALDLITWFLICALMYILAPRSCKEELGILIYLFVVIMFTIIWTIIFVFCGVNVIDLIHSNYTFIKMKL
jgi:hypothetical protein